MQVQSSGELFNVLCACLFSDEDGYFSNAEDPCVSEFEDMCFEVRSDMCWFECLFGGTCDDGSIENMLF